MRSNRKGSIHKNLTRLFSVRAYGTLGCIGACVGLHTSVKASDIYPKASAHSCLQFPGTNRASLNLITSWSMQWENGIWSMNPYLSNIIVSIVALSLLGTKFGLGVLCSCVGKKSKVPL